MTETLLDVKPEQAKHLPMEYAFLKKALQEIVTLEKGFSAQEHLSIPLALKLIKRSLQALRAVVIGDPMAPIQIMGLLETRSLHFDRVIMLGVNEGVLPATSPSPSLIPDNLRRAFDLPVIYNQQALSAYLFYRLVGQAQKTQLVYNRLHDGWSIGEPSRFIRQLSYESPLQLREQQVVLPDAPPVEERHIPLTEIAKKGEVWTKLQDYFSVNGQKPKRTMSASAFTLYLQSPLEFFYKYIAGIPEPPQLKGELEANTLGSMLHKVMELCYLEEKEKGIILQKDDILAKKQHLKAFSLQALKEQWPAYRLLHPELTGSEHILVQMTEKHAQILLEHDAKEVAPFQIIELENETDYHMPLPLQLPQQEVTVWLKGIIDRVDQCEEGFRIVDYKTGKDELVVKQKGKDDLENLSFFEGSWDNSNKAFVQTLYYTLIYEYCTGTEDVVPHVYSTRRLHESPETSFCESIYNSRSAPEPIKGPKLAHYKQVFYRFIQSKLEELFNPEIPFKHDPTVKIYPSSPYWNLVMQQALLENEEDADNPAL
jgi:ATP-dependent helicase/nuclease subunit B